MQTMKKILIFVAAATLAVCACHRENGAPVQEGVGSMSLKLTYGGEYQTKADEVNVNDFVITLTRPADGWTQTYDRYGDMDAMLQLGSGTYEVVAESPDHADAAFNQPVYRGEATFTIRAGEVTPVPMVCSLSNMKVTFVLTDRFRNELSNYTVTATNAADFTAADAGTRTLVWDKDAVDNGVAGYFSVAPLKIKVDGYRAIDGSSASTMLSVTNVAAKDHHIVTLDAQVTGQVGGFSLSLDATLNEKVSNVDIPGWDEVPVEGGGNEGGDDPTPDDPTPDDPTPSTAPTMVWEANPTFAETPIADGIDVNIQINAPKKIKTFTVFVDSDKLADTIAALGGTGYTDGGTTVLMDMISNEELIESLDGMGLGIPTADALYGKESVLFSLSNLIPMINMYEPEPGSKHYFTLRVSDMEDQVLEKTLTFVAQ